MKILALDLGKFNTMCCFFDAKTRKHSFLNVATERNYLNTLFKKHKLDLVVMEACGPSGWINDLAMSHGLMAAMNELKAVHMPTETHREFRSLVKYRKTLDSRINKMKCTIRAWFVNHGITIDSGEKAWHTGREHLNSFRKPLIECKPNELWKGELDIELSQLDSLTEQMEIVVKKLEVIGKNDPRIKRIQTIPGVGPRTAEILVACIDDPSRFSNGRQVSAYFGLVPRQYQSGETDRNGRITKRGNPLARTILVECAWASLRYNPWAKGVYDRICGKQKTRKKKAAIALARKIAVLAWALLRDQKDWDTRVMINTTKSFRGKLPVDEQELLAMKPKECRHKRKNRLAKEARLAANQKNSVDAPPKDGTSKPTEARKRTAKTSNPKPAKRTTNKRSSETNSKPRRARKLVTVA